MRPRRALLVASSALVVAVGGGCGGAKEPEFILTGNLVPPPLHQLCVTTTPAGAAVTIDGAPLEAGGCSEVWQGDHVVDARIDGLQPKSRTVTVLADQQLAIDLTTPDEAPAPAPAP